MNLKVESLFLSATHEGIMYRDALVVFSKNNQMIQRLNWNNHHYVKKHQN